MRPFAMQLLATGFVCGVSFVGFGMGRFALAENLNQKYGSSWSCNFLSMGDPGSDLAALLQACVVCMNSNQDFFRTSPRTGYCVPRGGSDQSESPRVLPGSSQMCNAAADRLQRKLANGDCHRDNLGFDNCILDDLADIQLTCPYVGRGNVSSWARDAIRAQEESYSQKRDNSGKQQGENDRPFNRVDPTGANKSRPWFRLMVCNHSGDGEMWFAADVANHNEDSQKIVRGWWSVGDGGCRAILERDFGDVAVPSMEIFLHAHTRNKQWPNKANTLVRLCLADYGPYQRTDLHPYNCRPEEKLWPFLRIVVNKSGDLFDTSPTQTTHYENFN